MLADIYKYCLTFIIAVDIYKIYKYCLTSLLLLDIYINVYILTHL